MREGKGFLINEEMREYLVMYEEGFPNKWVNVLIYEEASTIYALHPIPSKNLLTFLSV